jgi:excisionase family DNA binding protein
MIWAERLGLHVKTVRNYVREGRLKAVRIGKQYRISGDDLAALTGRPTASFRPEPVSRSRHVEVSSIVEIDAVSPETANRLSTTPSAAA